MRAEISPHQQKIDRIVASIIVGAFFCFLCFYFGVGVYPDSISYIDHYTEREPVYVLFLQLMRAVFTDAYDLQAVSILQNIFAGVVTWYAFCTMQKKFCLSSVWKWGLFGLLLLPHLMSGVFSSSHMVLTNAILSEGITYSLYQLCVIHLLQLLWTQEKRYFIYAMGIAFIACLARGHLMPLLLGCGFVAVVCTIREWRREKGCDAAAKGKKVLLQLGMIVGAILISFVLRSILIHTYNLAENGRYMGNSGGGITILTNVLYSSDPETLGEVKDALTEEEYIRLADVYADMEDRQLSYRYAESGIIQKMQHHEDAHDRIKFGRLYGHLRRLAESELYGYNYDQLCSGEVSWENPLPNDREVDEKADELAMRYAKLILGKNAGHWIGTYLYVALGGFVRTVGILNLPFLIGTIVLFALLLLMGVILYKKRLQEEADTIFLTLLLVCANVFATAITIMCLNRYMIYNTGLVYISFYIGILTMVETHLRSRSDYI